jgi:hypothetical protein
MTGIGGEGKTSLRESFDFGWFWTQGVGVGWYVAGRWGLGFADCFRISGFGHLVGPIMGVFDVALVHLDYGPSVQNTACAEGYLFSHSKIGSFICSYSNKTRGGDPNIGGGCSNNGGGYSNIGGVYSNIGGGYSNKTSDFKRK